MKIRGITIMEPKYIHTQDFRKQMLPPACTPDLGLLRGQEFVQILDWANCLRDFPTQFNEAYTIPKYYMFQCMHETGTPVILFNDQIDPRYITHPARIRGVIRLVRPHDMIAIDRAQSNGVHCIRKQIRVIVPRFFKANEDFDDAGNCIRTAYRDRRWKHIEPATILVWMYWDNAHRWKGSFNFDYETWKRNPEGEGGYRPLTIHDTFLDNRSYVGRVYQPRVMKQVKPKFGAIMTQNYTDRKRQWEQEDRFIEMGIEQFNNQEPTKKERFPRIIVRPKIIEEVKDEPAEDNKTTSTLPQVS